MKVLIVGATGAIGRAILHHVLLRPEVSRVIALTRKPLPDPQLSSHEKLECVIIPDFGHLENIQDETWDKMLDAKALVWAMGTYNLNEDVNFKYPVAFQEEFIKRLSITSSSQEQQDSAAHKIRFILLGGAFVEPDQSRTLFYLWDQRRMKGRLQTKTLDLGKSHPDVWDPIVTRPGGVMFGGFTLRNRATNLVFGTKLSIHDEELGACVGELIVNGSEQSVVRNLEMVDMGRKVLIEG